MYPGAHIWIQPSNVIWIDGFISPLLREDRGSNRMRLVGTGTGVLGCWRRWWFEISSVWPGGMVKLVSINVNPMLQIDMLSRDMPYEIVKLKPWGVPTKSCTDSYRGLG